MLYRPLKERLWDTWIVSHDSKFYLYYIRVSENGTRWDGISLAISDDLIHWVEYGTVLKKDESAIWLGTGMVQKIKDRFIMNYSQEKPAGEQKVFFAESIDLIHWKKIDDAVFEPDGIFYLKSNLAIPDSYPRWDSLGIVDALSEDNQPPYHAFFTSDSATFELPGKRGVLGFAESHDGIHWKHLPPATNRMDITPAFEVPEHVEFNGHHYVLFCTSSKLGYRFDPYASYQSGGTYYVQSSELSGPYEFPQSDPMLVGSRDNDNVTMGSVGRMIKIKDKVIFYHIWGDPIADGWVGPVKELVEVRKGELALRYFEGNERLKNMDLTYSLKNIHLEPTKKIGSLLPVEWQISDNLSFKNMGSSGMILSKPFTFPKTETDYADGRFIEFSLSNLDGVGAGLVLQTESNQHVTLFINKERKSLEFCKVTDGFCSNLVLQKIMVKQNNVIASNEMKVKVLFRQYFTEIYINNIYISGLRLTEKFRNDILGFYSEDSSGIIKDIKIYQMK